MSTRAMDLDALDAASVRRGLILLAAELRRVQSTRQRTSADTAPVRR